MPDRLTGEYFTDGFILYWEMFDTAPWCPMYRLVTYYGA